MEINGQTSDEHQKLPLHSEKFKFKAMNFELELVLLERIWDRFVLLRKNWWVDKSLHFIIDLIKYEINCSSSQSNIFSLQTQKKYYFRLLFTKSQIISSQS